MPNQTLNLGGRRPFDYDPPTVEWVDDGSEGHHPEPPPNPKTSDMDALRYDAAMLKARSGVDCRIGQLNSPATYDYAVYGLGGAWSSSGNCGNYWEAREFLRGIEIGVLAARGVDS